MPILVMTALAFMEYSSVRPGNKLQPTFVLSVASLAQATWINTCKFPFRASPIAPLVQMQPNCSRPRRSPRLPLVALTIGSYPASGIDNGLGITPPRGWRSWNLFHGAINDTVMRAQMAAVLDKSRSVDGKPTSLAELGFDWISMDDGWQQCNCSFPGFPSDPSLPKCPNCKEGGCSWHSSDAEGGRPLVDSHKFPDMKGLVDYGHSLGLKVGSYLNNCICMEGGDPPMGQHCNSPTHYQQDVARGILHYIYRL
ncbi:unnamed protein product [Prorocentrum cordatum]|uniref:Alpha-galactosidase n=1 Tax=Prorocentrum cordatum TaxID=2364126 RepID=A0ABN9YCZ2_9DINO|nr:unnamed protein product [Polarella glacialis]